VNAGRIPGFLVCVVKDGKLLHFKAGGYAEVEAKVPVQADTIFRLYSQTKPILIVGFMRLVERNQVKLNDLVSKYLPAFADLKVGEECLPLVRPLLVHDLLAHTSGIGLGPGFYYSPDGDDEKIYMELARQVDSGRVRSLAEWCDQLTELPLRFQPGSWGYGYSSDVLGRLVEVISGQPLDEFLETEVIKPLGLTDTCFALPLSKKHRLAALYKRKPFDGSGKNVKFLIADPGGSGCVSEDPHVSSTSVFLQGRSSPVMQGGGCVCNLAGGLVSTLNDYIRLGQMLLNGGELDGIRVLSPESVHMLTQDWLNEFTMENRDQPLWVWDAPGIGFSPLGQIGVAHPTVNSHRIVGSHVNTVHWGGAGGSSYMLNWPHKLLVLTYTGCLFDTLTQRIMWRAAFGALNRGKAKPVMCALPKRIATTGEVYSDDDNNAAQNGAAGEILHRVGATFSEGPQRKRRKPCNGEPNLLGGN